MAETPKSFTKDAHVETEVVEERGRWVVYLEVLDVNGSVRHRLQTYSTKRQAEVAASFFKRSASREIGLPTGF
jgi:hypothetical protein